MTWPPVTEEAATLGHPVGIAWVVTGANEGGSLVSFSTAVRGGKASRFPISPRPLAAAERRRSDAARSLRRANKGLKARRSRIFPSA